MFIGQYEIVRTLGKGGMGAVYVARDPAIDRLVAIKLLRDGIDSPEVRERFKREARSAGKLRHQNIVTIFHVGDHESRPYIVMEYIPGETLAEIIRQKTPLTIARKLRIMEEVCRGLAYAHKFGIVHRDVKPLNILVDTDGNVKILDFGIARVGEQGLTQLGMMMGTPNYMSPEQISPGRADFRSDVFAVGLVLYELLTYRRAFPGDDFSVLQKILQTEPEPVEKYCPDIDPELVQVLKRALAKKPDDRYQELAAMRQDIVRIWGRLKTADDEGSGEIAPLTPPEARYDGPTLVPGPNEQAPATLGQQRASDLARELARVAEEKRKAEELAQTPPMGTPRPAVDPIPTLPKVDDAKAKDAGAEPQRPAQGAAAPPAEPAARADAPRPVATGAPAPPPAADPTLSGPKKPPVMYTSTSEPTVLYRRPAEPGAEPTGKPRVSPPPGGRPVAAPPPPAPTAAPPPVPKPTATPSPSAATTEHAVPRPPQPGVSSPKPAPARAPWMIPAGAGALVVLLLGLRMLLSGGSPATEPPPAEPAQVSPASAATPQTTGDAPNAQASADAAALRVRVADAIARGDLDGAVGQLQGQPTSTDPAVAAIATLVVEASKAAAATAAGEALAAGAQQTPAGPYAIGLTQQSSADAVSASSPVDAARGYLEARRSFTTAAEAARTAAAVPPPAAPVPAPATPRAQAPPAPRPQPRPTRAADTASIQTLLQQYAEAYGRMDLNGVRAVWPGAPAGFNFAGNRTYTLNLRSPQLTELEGDRAVVTAVRHTVQELENGQKRENSVNITMTLRRVSGGWVIDTIQ